MFDVVALGELLIDFTPAGNTKEGLPLFEQNPGGAPANVLVALSKLGRKCAFLGMVGNDQFGTFLRDTLVGHNLDVTGLRFSATVGTTLAFVHLLANGERSFSFYRNPGADMMLRPEDLDYDLIKNAKVFHFGSISMTDEPSRNATLAAVKFAKEKGLLVSFDPNYRPLLWKSQSAAQDAIRSGMAFADLLKISQEELELITGCADVAEGAALLREQGIGVVLVTLGAAGCFYCYPGGTGHLDTYQLKTVDTTGAGDAFLGGILYWVSKLSKQEMLTLSVPEFERIVDFANATGALTTTKKGAIPALPDLALVTEVAVKRRKSL
jgi:fructokinase